MQNTMVDSSLQDSTVGVKRKNPSSTPSKKEDTKKVAREDAEAPTAVSVKHDASSSPRVEDAIGFTKNAPSLAEHAHCQTSPMKVEPTSSTGASRSGSKETKEMNKVTDMKSNIKDNIKDDVRADSLDNVQAKDVETTKSENNSAAKALKAFGGGKEASWDDWEDVDEKPKPAKSAESKAKPAEQTPPVLPLPSSATTSTPKVTHSKPVFGSTATFGTSSGAFSAFGAGGFAATNTGFAINTGFNIQHKPEATTNTATTAASTITSTATTSTITSKPFGSASSFSGFSSALSNINTTQPTAFSSLLSSTTIDTTSQPTTPTEHTTKQPQKVEQEENEFKVLSVRGKLYHVEESGDKGYKERGVGLLKVAVDKETGKKARLLHHQDNTGRLLLNVSLFANMHIDTLQDKFIRFIAFEKPNVATTFLLRIAKPEVLYDFVDKLRQCLDDIEAERVISLAPIAIKESVERNSPVLKKEEESEDDDSGDEDQDEDDEKTA